MRLNKLSQAMAFIVLFVPTLLFGYGEMVSQNADYVKRTLRLEDVTYVKFEIERYRKVTGNHFTGYVAFFDSENAAGMISSRNYIEIWFGSSKKPETTSEKNNAAYQKISISSSSFKPYKFKTGELLPAVIIKPFSLTSYKGNAVFRMYWQNEKTLKEYKLTSMPMV